MIFPLEDQIKARLQNNLDFATKQPLLKQLLGWQVAKRVKSGQKLGLGTGSTSTAAIQAIGQRIKKEHLEVFAISTSKKITQLAQELGFKLLNNHQPLDWGFDGADEIELNTFNMIKGGGGGAATQEKIIARLCLNWIIIADQSKVVDQLGKFPVMVEVVKNTPAAEIKDFFIKNYQALDVQPHPLAGNLYNVQFAPGQIKPEWETAWNQQNWLIDNGLFMGGWPNEVLIAQRNGQIKSIQGPGLR